MKTKQEEMKEYWKSKELILKDLVYERWKQDKKWGIQSHPPCVWMTILAEEVGEAAQEAMELTWLLEKESKSPEEFIHYMNKWREELVQCAAVCIAAIEEIEERTGL